MANNMLSLKRERKRIRGRPLPVEQGGQLEQLLHCPSVRGVQLLRVQLQPGLGCHQVGYAGQKLHSFVLELYAVGDGCLGVVSLNQSGRESEWLFRSSGS